MLAGGFVISLMNGLGVTFFSRRGHGILIATLLTSACYNTETLRLGFSEETASLGKNVSFLLCSSHFGWRECKRVSSLKPAQGSPFLLRYNDHNGLATRKL